ncbi:MAG: hypothetical protein RR182_01110 [Alistipes sp.]
MSTLLEFAAGCEEIVKTWPDWKRKSLNDALGLMTGPDSQYKSVHVDIDRVGFVQIGAVVKAVNATVAMGIVTGARRVQAIEKSNAKAEPQDELATAKFRQQKFYEALIELRRNARPDQMAVIDEAILWEPWTK